MNDFKDRANSAVERARGNQGEGQINEKICPFMSTKSEQVECTPQCQLYKAGKKGYACPVQELNAISFALRPR
ncbi:MAG: hypothetical protein KAS32_14000 [Candidatus Peribacteraceae bacterium]|nr:hypothetical protein [Candidatus Peribacteraceae bacterium]